jgi:hypothetical protein
VGVIVELLVLLPSLLVVELFRRTRSRQSALHPSNRRSTSIQLPWWCVFVTYGLCLMLVALSIFFLMVRGIEFGDEKAQQWLWSLLSGFFSSILFIQPLKVDFSRAAIVRQRSPVALSLLGRVSDSVSDIAVQAKDR